MPELPEVETLRRSLLPTLVGCRIDGVRVYDRRLRYPVRTRTLKRLVAGRHVQDVERRAKYLLLSLEDGGRILIHLGMSGRLSLAPAGEPREPHVHVVFELNDQRELRFRDPRRFGLVDVVTANEIKQDRRLTTLGVEPLSDDFNADRLHTSTRGLRKPIKNFLMDAKKVVGVGNIYASEALFLAGVHPKRAAGRLSLERWRRVVSSVKRVLHDAIERGGTTINDFQNGHGDPGFFQLSLRVYDRDGEPCKRCSGIVRRKVLAGRSTFYCPTCQR